MMIDNFLYNLKVADTNYYSTIEYHLVNNVELLCIGYLPPSGTISWEKALRGIGRRDLFWGDLLTENKKKYSLKMQLSIDHSSAMEYVFSVKGNLSEWYFQKTIERNFTPDEFKDALKLLFHEIGMTKIQVMNSKHGVLKRDGIHHYFLNF